jgi:nicotinamide-nucleotide amidase
MHSLVEELSRLLLGRGLMMTAAESCTGGLIAAAMTERSGSSAVFDRGFVTYSNDSKTELLGVSTATLAAHGAVSEQTAKEMALGALSKSRADISVSVTGIAGPSGGSDEKPVGLVYIGLAHKGGACTVHKHIFSGNRAAIRGQTVETALEHLINSFGMTA